MDLISNAGIIKCCDHAAFACLPDKCHCCHLYASIKINIIDVDITDNVRSSFAKIPVIDSKLLHEPLTREMLSHEPYTPESIDSHSPIEKVYEEPDEGLRRNSVSPDLLMKRLQSIKLGLSRSPRLMKRSASENVALPHGRENFFRMRAMSEVPKIAKARLISTQSAGSLHRLQSHHSSSDEDWFEFEQESPSKSLAECLECSENNSKESIQKHVPITENSEKKSKKRCRTRIKSSKAECCVMV